MVLGTSLAATAYGQAAPRPQADRHAAPFAASSSSSGSPAPRQLYENNLNFYDFVLHRLNPNNTNWGAWYEARRKALLDASVHNPDFWYSFWVTLAFLVSFTALLKSLSDRTRETHIMGEQMNKVRDYAAYSRRMATEAIHKYNAHIELCNRLIETEEGGLAATGGLQATQLQASASKVRDEIELRKRDRTRLEAEAKKNGTKTSDRSNPTTSPGNKRASYEQGEVPPDPMATSQTDLVRQIGSLQEQLYAEREKNKRLKGGA
jgi:hypothetical protein